MCRVKKFSISAEERRIVKRFMEAKYPPIYKLDLTDSILFVELVNFDVCPVLLKGKTIKTPYFNDIMNEYSKYLLQIDISTFDKHALSHYNDLTQIMKMFEKYHRMGDDSHPAFPAHI